MPEPDSKQIKHLHNKTVTGTLERVIQLILNRRNVVYGVAISVVILGIIGLTLMKSTGYMVDDLKETDPIRQDLSFFEENFDGLMPLEVTVDFGKPKQVLNLPNLQKLDKLSEELSKDEDISKPIPSLKSSNLPTRRSITGNPLITSSRQI